LKGLCDQDDGRIASSLKDAKDLKLRGSLLRVIPTVEPELIIWNNFGIKRVERFLRSLLFYVIVLGLLVIVFTSVSTLEKKNWELAQLVPSLNCPAEITEAKASADYKIKDLPKRAGDYHCFCKNMLEKDGSGKTSAYKFKLDGDKTLCA